MKVLAMGVILIGLSLIGIEVYKLNSSKVESRNESNTSSVDSVSIPQGNKKPNRSTLKFGRCPSATTVNGETVNFIADCSSGVIIGKMSPYSNGKILHEEGLIHPHIAAAPDVVIGLHGWTGTLKNPETWSNRPYPNERLYATLVVVGQKIYSFSSGDRELPIANDTDREAEVKIVYNGDRGWYGNHTGQIRFTFLH